MSERLYHTPMGLSTERPDVQLPPIDRRAVIANAHQIAGRFRPHMANYRAALNYGFKVAWQQHEVARSIAMLKAQVRGRTPTAEEIIRSRRATRRAGSSFT